MKKEFYAHHSDGWEIVLARDFTEVESLRPVWQEMQRDESPPIINADIDRYLSVVESMKEAVQPHIMLLYYNGKPEAMAIGHIGRREIACQLGYATILKPSLRCLSIVYGGILGQPNAEACSVLLKELERSLRNDEADLVVFNHLPIDSEMYQLTKSAVSFFCRSHFSVLDKHWKAFLPDSYEKFFHSRSKNTKHNIRRYSKRLVSKYDSRLSIKCFTKTDQIDQLFNDTVEVAEKTYQHGMGCAFVDDIKTRNLINHSIARKWLIAYILYINEKPCAFWHGIRYGKTFFTFSTGYDPAYHNDRLGLFLLVKVFEDLCQNHSVDAVDFGFGDAQYKDSFCDVFWMEASVYIFAPRFYPICVNGLLSSITGVSLGMSFLAQKISFQRWIKRQWRNLLQATKLKSKV